MKQLPFYLAIVFISMVACMKKNTCKRDVPSSVRCSTELDPVCGCDGKTYRNSCSASSQIMLWTKGACKQ